jgi:hypothetical protein
LLLVLVVAALANVFGQRPTTSTASPARRRLQFRHRSEFAAASTSSYG